MQQMVYIMHTDLVFNIEFILYIQTVCNIIFILYLQTVCTIEFILYILVCCETKSLYLWQTKYETRLHRVIQYEPWSHQWLSHPLQQPPRIVELFEESQTGDPKGWTSQRFVTSSFRYIISTGCTSQMIVTSSFCYIFSTGWTSQNFVTSSFHYISVK